MTTLKFTPEELSDLKKSVNYHIYGKRLWMKDNFLNLGGRYLGTFHDELEDLEHLLSKLGPDK